MPATSTGFMPTPDVAVHENRKSGDFVVVELCVDTRYGWVTDWGEPHHFSAAEMETIGVETVLKSLREFSNHDCASNTVVSRSSSELHRFFRQHLLVHVTLVEPTKLHVRPWIKERGGYRGDATPQHQIYLPYPCEPKILFAALTTAFTYVR